MMIEPGRRRIGAALRAVRQDRGWSQRRLAAEAGLSASVVGSTERGEPGASLETMERLATALGARVAMSVQAPPLLGQRDATDVAHARCVAVARHLLERAHLECAVEQPVAGVHGRGWIDLLAFDRTLHRLLVVEVKTELRDVGALERQVELYARECLGVARDRAWTVAEVAVVVVTLATAAADEFVAANRRALAAGFPARGRCVAQTMLDGGPIIGRGLVMLDPLRPGRKALTSFRADGRRTDAPYRDYADFMAALRASHTARPLRWRSRSEPAKATITASPAVVSPSALRRRPA